MTDPNPPAGAAGEAPRPRIRAAAPKPPESEYGYVDSHAHPSTRHELVQRMAEGRPTPFVWTPETDGVVPYWAVPYLFDAYRAHGMRHSRKVALAWGGIGAALVAWAVASEGKFDFLNAFVLVGIMALMVGFYSFLELGRFRRLTPDKLTLKVREQATRPPPRRGPAVYTQVVAGAITLVMAAQALTCIVLAHKPPPIMLGASAMIPSIEAAGMVRAIILQGHQIWRLLSAEYLHDGLLHYGMNLMAFLALGKMIEAFSHRAYVPLVFLVAALGASAASCFITKPELSVGASGGILGMFGFLAVMARQRREMMPPGFGKAILIDISVIAAFGIVGAGHVDNGAHAGGFVTGAFLGWLMIPRGGRTAYWEPSPPIRVLGDVAMAILLAGALWTTGVLGYLIAFPHLAR